MAESLAEAVTDPQSAADGLLPKNTDPVGASIDISDSKTEAKSDTTLSPGAPEEATPGDGAGGGAGEGAGGGAGEGPGANPPPGDVGA